VIFTYIVFPFGFFVISSSKCDVVLFVSCAAFDLRLVAVFV